MKAIIYKKYGAPDVLHVENMVTPIPKDNEVLINVHASEVTKSDCELRSFNFPVKWFWLPLRIMMGITRPKRSILGGYFSGEIVSIGKDVSNCRKGDLVFGSAGLRMGTYGEYLCLPDSYTIIEKPKNMSFVDAAAVPLGGLNALHYLRKANIKNGEKILINGAGGSIGVFGVQIAKLMGAEVTVVDSAIKEDMLRSIGADKFINFMEEDFTEQSSKYDVIFDMVAQSSYSGCIKSLSSGGRYLMANPRVSDMLKSVLTTKYSDKTVLFSFAGEKKDELLALKEMIEEGKLISVVDKVYAMDNAPEAHRRVEAEKRLGSIVITMKCSKGIT